MSQTPDHPPTPPEKGKIDSRLESFLRRAAPIIAAERGMTETARVKLESIARDMKLPQEMFDQAVQMLQNEPPVIKHELDRYEAAFKESMREKLRKVPRGIITARTETRAVEVGTEKYQLSELQAREILRTLIGEMGLQRISVTQAERHMENTIEELIGDATIATEATRTRLIEFGKSWGLSEEHVEAMIRHFTDLNLQSKKSEGNLIKLLVACIILVLVGIIGAIGYSVFRGSGETKTTIEEKDSKTDDDTIAKFSEADFWDTDLSVAIVKAKLVAPALSGCQNEMASADPLVRNGGYAKLLLALPGIAKDEKSRERLAPVFKKLIQLEPDQDNTRMIINSLIAAATVSVDKFPVDNGFVDRARWIVDLLAETRFDAATESSRAQLINDNLFRATGFAGGDVKNLVATQRSYQSGLLETQLRRLNGMVSQDPAKVVDGYVSIVNQSATLLSDSKKLELNSAFIQSAISVSGDKWSGLTPLMEWSVKNAQKDQLVQLIEAYETTGNLAAQRQLGRLLETAVDIRGIAGTPREIAKAMRDKLGVAQPVRRGVEQQREELTGQIKKFQSSLDLNTTEMQTLSANIARAAYWSTMASYLVSGNLESAEFAELVKLGPPDAADESYLKQLLHEPITEEASSEREKPPRISQDQLEKMLVPIGKQHKANSIQQRVNALRSASLVAVHLGDVPAPIGYGIGGYLLAGKNENEQKEVLAVLPSLRHWPSLLVGVAEQLDSSDLAQEQQQQIISALLPETVVRNNREQWVEETRRALLILSLQRYREIKPETRASDTQQTWNHLQSIAKELTRRQAINFGVAPGQANADLSLLIILNNWYATMHSETSGPEQQVVWERQRDLQSARYMSGGPLQEAVVIQQLIIRQIADNKLATAGVDAMNVRAIVKKLQDRNRQAENVAQQLLYNELALAELLLVK